MAVVLTKTPGTLPFDQIVDLARTRLAQWTAVVDGATYDAAVSPTLIRVVCVPDTELPTYLSEPGFLFRVRAMEPVPTSGGGRWDYRVSRIVDVVVITLNLSDPGGRDDIGVKAHLQREEAVCDALNVQPPVGAPNNNTIPYAVHFMPGGEEIRRQMKLDPGLLVSVLSFRFSYRLCQTVKYTA